MKLFFPDNIFTRMIVKNLPAALQKEVAFLPSSMLTKKLNETENSAALIPATDLINNKDLFVSKSFGISFEGSLCNSYIYFNGEQKDITEVNLLGDISSAEVILGKILFKELYNTDINIGILTDESKIGNGCLIIAGDKNLKSDLHFKGISFAEEMVETMSLPYVNFIFASANDLILKDLNQALEGIGSKVYESADSIIEKENLSPDTSAYVQEDISSFIMELGEQDIEGINQIVRLPYFHGVVDDIVEVKFV